MCVGCHKESGGDNMDCVAGWKRNEGSKSVKWLFSSFLRIKTEQHVVGLLGQREGLKVFEGERM